MRLTSPSSEWRTILPRSRDSAKRAGRWMQQLVADYWKVHIDPDVEQRKLSGTKDRGDISGIKIHGQRIAVEVKNTAKLTVASFLAEAEQERINDDALAGVVIAKRTGKAQPEDQLVIMTLRDFTAILTGTRPE